MTEDFRGMRTLDKSPIDPPKVIGGGWDYVVVETLLCFVLAMSVLGLVIGAMNPNRWLSSVVLPVIFGVAASVGLWKHRSPNC